MHIRNAADTDQEDVRRVHLAAFPESEARLVSQLAVNLLAEDTTPPTISLVAEVNGGVVGHVAFSPVIVDGNERWRGYLLSPLGVAPGHQKRGIGTKLIQRGMQQLSDLAINVLFVYGDPQYYSRFGFTADAALPFLPPYELQYPFGWQAIILNESNMDPAPIRIACVSSLRDPDLW